MKKLFLLILCFHSIFIFSCKKNLAEGKALFKEGMGSEGDAYLKGIQCKVDGEIFPLAMPFNATTYSYNVMVPYKAESVKLEAVASGEGAEVSIDNAEVQLDKTGGSCKAVVITCTSKNKEAKRVYIVQVERSLASKERRASSLVLFYDNGKFLPLNEAFYSGKTEYSADLPEEYMGDVELRVFPYSTYAKVEKGKVTMTANEAVIEGKVQAEDASVPAQSYKVTLKKVKFFSNSEADNLSILSIEYNGKQADFKSVDNAFVLYVPVKDEKDAIKNALKIKSYGLATIEELDESDSFPKIQAQKKTYIINIQGKAGKNRNYKLVLMRTDEKGEENVDLSLEKIEFVSSEVILPIDCVKDKSDVYTKNIHANIREIQVVATPKDKTVAVAVSPHGKVEIDVGDRKTFLILLKDKSGTEKKYTVVVEKKLEGMVRVLGSEMRIPPKDLPYLDANQQKASFFAGAFTVDNVVMYPYEIGMYEVNYELWYNVRLWAEKNGYRFANKGCQGENVGQLTDNNKRYTLEGVRPSEKKHTPVTAINWRDAIVWCNAYSEMHDLEPVYKYDGKVFKDATWNRQVKVETTNNQYLLYEYYYADIVVRDEVANGYRLPTMAEWEMAARGGDLERDDWNYAFPGVKGYEDGKLVKDNLDYASGEVADYAWYVKNSSGKTHNVGEKKPNSLAIYDMAGNVYEICEDVRKYENPADSMDDKFNIFVKGGSYQVSGIFALMPPYFMDYYYTETKARDIGFRLARSIF